MQSSCMRPFRELEEAPEDDTFDLFAEEPPADLHEREWTSVEVGGAGAVTSLLVEPQHGVVWDSALLVSKWLLERPELCRGRRCAEVVTARLEPWTLGLAISVTGVAPAQTLDSRIRHFVH